MSNNGKNEWDQIVFDGGKENSLALDELSEVQKAQIMNYVAASTQKDKEQIAMLTNAMNVLFACLENGIPVKDGKVQLRPEDMRILAIPKSVN